MMTLQEAINHCLDVSEHGNVCEECRADHKQLAEWLQELQHFRRIKCQPPDGIIIKPDGENELDPCEYEEIETHYNATVHVLKCKKCGHVDIGWERSNGDVYV